MKENILNFVRIGNHIADEARKISLRYFKKKFKVQSKDLHDFDPVTIADISIQKKINKIISINFPEHSVLGEEASIKKNNKYEWCIDPIDGTKSFIQGFPVWGTLISLSRKKEIILGIADIPALDERYVGYSNISYKVIKGKKASLELETLSNLKKVF